MTDRASLADAIDPRKHRAAQVYGTACYQLPALDLIAASDALRAPPPDHAALVQALLATCDRLGMVNRPADAPAAFARVLGEFGGSGADAKTASPTAGEQFRAVLQERIDFHEVNGSMAEAADVPESAAHHDAVRKELQALMDDLNTPPTDGEREAAVVDEIVEYFAHIHAENPPISGYEVRSDILDMLTRARALTPHGDESAAIRDVVAERNRQIEVEGWTPAHDDEHGGGQLAKAAACYATGSTHTRAEQIHHDGLPTRATKWISLWPWDLGWWKPADRRRNLVKAGALILAEIERLDRITSHGALES